ncbi:hypothetical protein [Siccirubricoccus soli]
MAEDPKPDSKAAREARLAAALRANLRRRKAQARGREVAQPSEPAPETEVPTSRPRPPETPSD